MVLFRLTRLARQDLKEIYAYVARESGDQRAQRLIRDIVEVFPTLSAFPGSDTRRDDLSRGLLGFPVHKYLVFYRRHLNGVRIVRVIHGGRDLPKMFPT